MMKRKILEIMDKIDDKYINEALEYEMLKPKAKGQWIKWGIMAACVTVIILAGAIVLPVFMEYGVSEQRWVTLEEMNRPYRDLEVKKIACEYDSDFVGGGAESGWPVEYLTLAERVDSLTFQGDFYDMHGWADASLIGEMLGDGECKIYDSSNLRGQDNVVGKQLFQVYELHGISKDLMVAVKIDEEFWLFINRYEQPKTLGDWMNIYNLSENMKLHYFSIIDEDLSKNYFALENSEYIWSILLACQDAEDEGNKGYIWNSIDFTVTIEKFQMYNKFFRITENGYVWTDMFSGNKSFFIGEENARKIIAYAAEYGVETTYKRYEPHSLVGYIEEITEDYILVNDGILCEDKNDGISFKISLEDIKVRRYVECINLQVQELVWVDFRGEIDTKKDNLVEDVFEIGKSVIWDGTKQIINGYGQYIESTFGVTN